MDTATTMQQSPLADQRYADVCIEVVDSKGKGQSIRGLLDSGCSRSIILKRYTDRKRLKDAGKSAVTYKTYGGSFTTQYSASVGFRLIEFSNSKQIKWDFQVDSTQQSGNVQYDMIIGSDLMAQLGIDIAYSTKEINWDGETIPMKTLGELAEKTKCEGIYFAHTQPPILQMEEERQQKILDADYTKVDIDAMVKGLDITRDEKRALIATLKKFPKLFGGGLGQVNIEPVTIELQEGIKPVRQRYYSVPHAFERPMKKEIQRMVAIGVLEKLLHDDDSPWASPSFCQAKKTGDIRILTDFRKMNAAIQRKPFPLPRIGETIQRLQKFKSATALDLSQGYYSIPICNKSQKICTTVLPWGKYAYKRLAMGIACAPDIFQSIMMELLGDLDYVLVYIDDILIVQREGESTEDHLAKIEEVLRRLDTKGFRANLRKSFFMQKEVEYLGYLLTTEGILPQPKKVDAMKRMAPPTNTKQLKCFLGMINFYRDMWEKRSHILAPLNTLSGKLGKKNWKWGPAEAKAFIEAKKMLAKAAMLSFPDFTKPFHLYSDASDKQLGATVVQDGKPLGFYTRKLNPAQKNYTVGERELLGIVEGLKAFEGILRGQEVICHTDHLNLLYQEMPTQRMVRWRLLLEEFHPIMKHVAGKDNDAADALSRLDMLDNEGYDELEWEQPNKPLKYTNDKEQLTQMLYSAIEEEQFQGNDKFPLATDLMQFYQQRDKDLQNKLKNNNKLYTTKTVERYDLVHYNDKILVPEALKERVLDWYHTMLVHPGVDRMEASIRAVFTWKGLRGDVQKLCKHCHTCQMFKKSGRKKYGLLPAKQAEVVKWQRVNVDLWGPASVHNKIDGKTHQIHVMTMVDPVTGWFELAHLTTGPTALEAQRLLDSVWLARYPRPKEIGFDNGSEFKAEFRELCENMGLKKKPSLAWNPQANAILERVHQVLKDCLSTFNLEMRELQENDPFEEFTTKAAYAIRSAIHSTLGYSPAQLVFGRDMFMPVNIDADWNAIRERKQKRIDNSNTRENKKRIAHTYKAGDYITLAVTGIRPKLSPPRKGPFKILEAHANGTLTIELEPFVTDRVNVRRVHPYYYLHNPNE